MPSEHGDRLVKRRCRPAGAILPAPQSLVQGTPRGRLVGARCHRGHLRRQCKQVSFPRHRFLLPGRNNALSGGRSRSSLPMRGPGITGRPLGSVTVQGRTEEHKMESSQIQFWSMLAEWLGAVGTVSAVIVALWLALRAGRVRLKLRVEVYRLEGDPKPRAIIWSVTNTGDRRVTIEQVGFRIRQPRVPGDNRAMPRDQPPCVPRILHPGDHAVLKMAWRLSTMKELAASKPDRAYVFTGAKYVHARMGTGLKAFFKGDYQDELNITISTI